jgi:hypothetical protein
MKSCATPSTICPTVCMSCSLQNRSNTLGYRAAKLGSAGVDEFFAEPLVVVVHLAERPAFCSYHFALSQSVKALTEADEPRDFGPAKLTKVEVEG